MNEQEKNLSLRAIAAGAPVPALKRSPFTSTPCLLTPGLADMPEGTQWRCPDGLRYEVAMVQDNLMLLPLLSDPSWWGWALCAVRHRGWKFHIESTTSPSETYDVTVFRGYEEHTGLHMDRPATIVTMLEATK